MEEPTSGPLCSASLSLSLTPSGFPGPVPTQHWPQRHASHLRSRRRPLLRSLCAPPPGPLLAHAAQPWPGVELTDRFPSKPSTAHRFRCRNGRALS